MESYDIDGQAPWLLESPSVSWKAKRFYNPARAAVEAAEEKFREGKSKKKGISFYAVPVIAKGAPRPTRKSWIESQRKKSLGIVEEPTDKRISDRNKAAEERAKQKLREMGRTVD